MINSTIIYADSLKDRLNELTSSTDGEIEGFVNAFINFAFPLSVVCLFLLLSFSAYKLITSRGNPESLKEAREQIGSAVMGFVFILLSVLILVLLSSLFGIQLER
ncbi:hypothetical protein GX888_02700 [Candidatus Dojkabacteria bacterium]|uniref:Uncharacterized protein n=1 Tax=Candidatus Dojkabacteria bacterium TaxID=2099670 RepID=A0A847VDZ6_9BACT|nr:hypothetical protein [Candidatus Dojkabacteria bacterium]